MANKKPVVDSVYVMASRDIFSATKSIVESKIIMLDRKNSNSEEWDALTEQISKEYEKRKAYLTRTQKQDYKKLLEKIEIFKNLNQKQPGE